MFCFLSCLCSMVISVSVFIRPRYSTYYSTYLKMIGLVTLKPVTCIYMYIGFNATTPLASDFIVPAICGKDRVNRKNKNHVIKEEAKGL